MGYRVIDTTGEIKQGSIYLPVAKLVAIGEPVVGVQVVALQEELSAIYGDRFKVEEITAPKPAKEAAAK
jgi:hypothetical protein